MIDWRQRANLCALAPLGFNPKDLLIRLHYAQRHLTILLSFIALSVQ